MYFLEKLVRIVERAEVSPYTGHAYRIVADKWRDSPLSAMGSVRSGGRYNAPNSFPVLYCAESQLPALVEVDALFATADGKLRGVPRHPDLVLTVECKLLRVLDVTDDELCAELGTSTAELTSQVPSRFILNARGQETPTQTLGGVCSSTGNISAIKSPSATNADGFWSQYLSRFAHRGRAHIYIGQERSNQRGYRGRHPQTAHQLTFPIANQ